jgi:hypothetical protein
MDTLLENLGNVSNNACSLVTKNVKVVYSEVRL